MTSFKITFINELSGLKEIIDIPDDKYILDAQLNKILIYLFLVGLELVQLVSLN